MKVVDLLKFIDNYDYLPMEKVGNDVYYLCQCENCKMKGAEEIKQKLETWFGIQVGGTSKDGKVSLKYAHNLGWCINNAPGVMLKRKGIAKVIPIAGIKDMLSLSEFYLNMDNYSNIPNNKIKYQLYTRFGDQNPSYFRKVNEAQLKENLNQLSKEQAQKIISEYQLFSSNNCQLAISMRNQMKAKALLVNLNENNPCNFTKWAILSNSSPRYNLLMGMFLYAKLSNCEQINILLKYEYRNVKELLIQDAKLIATKYPEFKNIQLSIKLNPGNYMNSINQKSMQNSFEGELPFSQIQSNDSLVEEPDNLIKLALILQQTPSQLTNKDKITLISELNIISLTGNVQIPYIIECPKSSSFDFILAENELPGAYYAQFNKPSSPILDFNQFSQKMNAPFTSAIVYSKDLPLEAIYLYKFEMLQQNTCKEKLSCKLGGKLLSDILQQYKERKINLNDYNQVIFQIQKFLEMSCTNCEIGKSLANIFNNLASQIQQIPEKVISTEKLNITDGCPASAAKTDAEKKSACEGCPLKSSCSSNSNSKEKDKQTPQQQQISHNLGLIKHKLLILSGKGGVGKSTVATQLALQLASKVLGFKVGLLDIDIAGPSIPTLLGLQGQHVKLSEDSIEPVKMDDNLSVMSIGFLLQNQDDAVIWRGPKKTGLISQFLSQVEWGLDGNLDFLVIDTPPGTSDEHISLAQMLKISKQDGAIIVTTPQEVALADVRKGIQFCKKAEIPILGVVENMSKFICPKCKSESRIFPATSGGAELMAVQFGIELLGQIPLKMEISHKLDRGQLVDQDQLQEFQTIIKNLEQFFPLLKEKKAPKPVTFDHFY